MISGPRSPLLVAHPSAARGGRRVRSKIGVRREGPRGECACCLGWIATMFRLRSSGMSSCPLSGPLWLGNRGLSRSLILQRLRPDGRDMGAAGLRTVFSESGVPLSVEHLAEQIRNDSRRVGVERAQLYVGRSPGSAFARTICGRRSLPSPWRQAAPRRASRTDGPRRTLDDRALRAQGADLERGTARAPASAPPRACGH